MIQFIGETTEYDKKQLLEVKKPKSWCKSISAFANGIGGKLIFGVADDDTIVGLDDASKDAETISETIKQRIDPLPEINLKIEHVDGDKSIIIVEVMAGNQTPYYYSGDGQLIAFVRMGNESIPATSLRLRELVLRGSNLQYDTLVSPYNVNDMAFTLLKSAYYSRNRRSMTEEDLISFGIVDMNGRLTNAGALLADYSPVYNSRVFCTRWKGLTKADGLMDALDDDEYSGSLITLLDESIKFVRRNNRKPWYKSLDGRIELPEYPEKAVEEGIVNALIHRNYLEIGCEVHIDIFDDRLEIFSPGGMLDGSRVQDLDLMNVASRRRNPVLVDIFSRLKYMERRGSGFKKILKDYENHPLYKDEYAPKMESNHHDFILILKNMLYGVDINNTIGNEDVNGVNDVNNDVNNGVDSGVNGVNYDVNDEINIIESQILRCIESNSEISILEISEALGCSRRTIDRNLKKLRDKGIIERQGTKRSGKWVVLSK